LVGSRIWAIYNTKTEFVDKSRLVLGRIFAADLSTVRRRMPHLDSMISSQRAYADFYENKLSLDPGMYCLEKPKAQYNRFMYPLIFRTTEQRDMMAAHLRKSGIGTASPYEDVIQGATEHYGYEGDCPSAETALRRTLVIPSYYALKNKDIKYIASQANQGYSKISNRKIKQLVF
jgi:dTDP-4-amino-4,6-dideoxygalactose transaminase